MNISDFRSIAEIPNAHVVLDSHTDELKVRSHTFLHRAVDWIRARVAPNPLARTERDAAHNRFLRAIADYSGYDSADVSRAEAMLSVDLLEGRALSARRVREVIRDLDSRSTEVIRENRTTAAWMAGRGVETRLRELAGMEEGPAVTEVERQLLSARVEEAIGAAGGVGGHSKVEFGQAREITDGIVDGFLAGKAGAAELEVSTPEQPGAVPKEVEEDGSHRVEHAARQIGGSAEPGDSLKERVAAPAIAPETPAEFVETQREASVVVPARAAAGLSERVGQKELLSTLGRARLPAVLRNELRRLVKTGGIVDERGLATHANQRLAAWVLENRVGRWYGEALRAGGTRGRIRDGEILSAPRSMLDEVADRIRGSEELVAYPAVKTHARATIAEYVRRELVEGKPA